MKPGRARIINDNYVFTPAGDRLIPATEPWMVWQAEPWLVTTDRKTKRFPTHAEAITWATRKTRKRKGKK